MQRWPCRTNKLGPKPEKFGDELCGDTLMAYTNESWGLEGEEFGVVLFDRGAKYYGGYPVGTKTAVDAEESIKHFLGNSAVKRFYTDCAPELIRAGKDLNLMHDTSTPYRPDTNGVAESAVRRVV